MKTYEKIQEKMKNKIMKKDDICFASSRFYWLAQLDYDRKDSCPEHRVLEKFIREDMAKILEGIRLMDSYKKLGIDFKELL